MLRPAHDLLENLLDVLRGCRLLFNEHADVEEISNIDNENADARVHEMFLADFREEAQEQRSRLL